MELIDMQRRERAALGGKEEDDPAVGGTARERERGKKICGIGDQGERVCNAFTIKKSHPQQKPTRETSQHEKKYR